MKYIVLVFLSLLFAAPVFALTQQDVDVLIQAGLILPDKVAAARAAAEADSGVSQTTTTTTSTTVAAGTNRDGCLNLSTDVVTGLSGSAVSALQTFLREQGYFTHPEITGFYGSVTQRAVEAFQSAQNIVGSGTPTTTGFGSVGPQTREKIRQLTCLDGATTTNVDGNTGTSTDTFFGYNLDELFNYEADFDYDTEFDTDFSFDYEADFDFDYDVEDFDAAFDYEADFDYDASGAFGSEDERTTVELTVRVPDGRFIPGLNGNQYLYVEDRTVEISWEAQNADICELTGDYPEGRLAVPLEGSASVYLVNPSYQVPTNVVVNEFGFNSKPGFGIRITCRDTDDVYGVTASDLAVISFTEEVFQQTIDGQ